MKSSELKTVPSFLFYQGEEGIGESPILVSFWNGTVELEQSGNSISLDPNEVIHLAREIKNKMKEIERFRRNVID